VRRLRRLCAVIALCVLLDCPASAGVMPFPAASPPPASDGEMPTPSREEASADGQNETMSGATRTQLLLLLNLLAAAMP